MARFPDRLILAVKEKRDRDVVRLLTDDVVHQSDPFGRTLLHYAAGFSNGPTLRHLLARGAAVDAADRNGWTPLMVAISTTGADDCVAALLQAGANVNATTSLGNSPLQQTFARNSSAPTIALVLQHAERIANDLADLANSLIRARCPAYHAIQMRNALLLDELARRGLDLNAREPANGLTAVHVAARLMDLPGVRVLQRHRADFHAEDAARRSVVFHLYSIPTIDQQQQQQRLAIAAMLHGMGVPRDPYSETTYGENQYSNLMINGLPGDIQLIWDRVVAEHFDDMNNNVVHLLAANRNIGIRQFIDTHVPRIDLNSLNAFLETPLFWAARFGNADVVQYLLELGVNANHETRRGYTPIVEIFAVPHDNILPSHAQCVTLLLNSRANPQVRVPLGPAGEDTIIHIGLRQGNFELVQQVIVHLAEQEARAPGFVRAWMRIAIGANPMLEAIYNVNFQARMITELMITIFGNGIIVQRIMDFM